MIDFNLVRYNYGCKIHQHDTSSCALNYGTGAAMNDTAALTPLRAAELRRSEERTSYLDCKEIKISNCENRGGLDMGREVRMVPHDWKHPTDANGNYIPLLDGFAKSLASWLEGNAKWQEGLRSDFNGGWKPLDEEEMALSYADLDGDCPQEKDYMPEWSPDIATHFMMYEDTSEGTPISPAFATPEELARWLADNKASAFCNMTATYDQWLETIHRGGACGMVIEVRHDGVEIMSGVAANVELGK